MQLGELQFRKKKLNNFSSPWKFIFCAFLFYQIFDLFPFYENIQGNSPVVYFLSLSAISFCGWGPRATFHTFSNVILSMTYHKCLSVFRTWRPDSEWASFKYVSNLNSLQGIKSLILSYWCSHPKWHLLPIYRLLPASNEINGV